MSACRNMDASTYIHQECLPTYVHIWEHNYINIILITLEKSNQMECNYVSLTWHHNGIYLHKHDIIVLS